jgi:hypothetical protein
MRVLTIFVRHGTDKYERAEQELTDLFQSQLPDVERHTVVVDTARPRHEIERQPGRDVTGSDNASWEFTGFDAGLAQVGDDVWAYDLVNLTTSAFRQLYAGYLERFRPEVLQSIVGRPVCLGHIDCYNEVIEVGGCASQHWVRSSCLFIPPLELKILGTLISTGERDRWFSGNPQEPFRTDAPLSAAYRRLITDWLTGQDIGQGVSWHSPMGLDTANLQRFEQKTMAILNEHLLGIRLRASGCRTIDVTWLSGLLARRRAGPIDWNTPWWRQLAGRDRDAIHVEASARIA